MERNAGPSRFRKCSRWSKRKRGGEDRGGAREDADAALRGLAAAPPEQRRERHLPQRLVAQEGRQVEIDDLARKHGPVVAVFGAIAECQGRTLSRGERQHQPFAASANGEVIMEDQRFRSSLP